MRRSEKQKSNDKDTEESRLSDVSQDFTCSEIFDRLALDEGNDVSPSNIPLQREFQSMPSDFYREFDPNDMLLPSSIELQRLYSVPTDWNDYLAGVNEQQERPPSIRQQRLNLSRCVSVSSAFDRVSTNQEQYSSLSPSRSHNGRTVDDEDVSFNGSDEQDVVEACKQPQDDEEEGEGGSCLGEGYEMKYCLGSTHVILDDSYSKVKSPQRIISDNNDSENDSPQTNSSSSPKTLSTTNRSITSSLFDADLEVMEHNRVGYRRRMSGSVEATNSSAFINGATLSNGSIDHSRTRSYVRPTNDLFPEYDHNPSQAQSDPVFISTANAISIRHLNLAHNIIDADDNTLSGRLSVNSASTSSTIYLQLPAETPTRDGATLESERFFVNNSYIISKGTSSESGSSPDSKQSPNDEICGSRGNILLSGTISKNDEPSSHQPSAVSNSSPRKKYLKKLAIKPEGVISYAAREQNMKELSHEPETIGTQTSATTETTREVPDPDYSGDLRSFRPPRSPHSFSGQPPSRGHRRTQTPLASVQPAMNTYDQQSPLSPPKVFADSSTHPMKTLPLNSKKPVANILIAGIFADRNALLGSSYSGKSKAGKEKRFIPTPRAVRKNDLPVVSPEKELNNDDPPIEWE